MKELWTMMVSNGGISFGGLCYLGFSSLQFYIRAPLKKIIQHLGISTHGMDHIIFLKKL